MDNINLKPCPFCKDYTTTDIPIKSNADTARSIAMIAQGDRKKEIVFSINNTAYAIEINFCPICGAKCYGDVLRRTEND